MDLKSLLQSRLSGKYIDIQNIGGAHVKTHIIFPYMTQI